jgi:hypothetical protein
MVASPLDASSYTRYRNLTVASAAFMWPGVDDVVSRRAADCAPDPCAAINEAVGLHRAMERLSDREDESFWAFASRRTCDSSLLNLLESSPPSSLEALSRDLSSDPLPLEKYLAPETAANPFEFVHARSDTK